jgi:transposase-like protein
MANKRRRDRIKPNGSKTFADDPSATKREEHLRRRFEEFRREHRPRTPIPQALRAETLATLRDGMAELTVRRACGISPEQLYWWRKAQHWTEQGSERGRHKAQVLTVVDDVSAIAVQRDSDHQAPNLELRIDRWVVCIRQHEA